MLAIAGGTTLTLALTRPQLKWLERVTEDSPKVRLSAQVGLTILAFAAGGYAWATLFLTLRGQLDHKSAALVKGAAFILVVYALLTHFEPFVACKRQPRFTAAMAFFYVGIAIFAVVLGIARAEWVRTSGHLWGEGLMLEFAPWVGLCWLLALITLALEAGMDRLLDGHPTKAPIQPELPLSWGGRATANDSKLAPPSTRTPACSSRA